MDALICTVDKTTLGAKHSGPHGTVTLLHDSKIEPQLPCRAAHDNHPEHGCGVGEELPAEH